MKTSDKAYKLAYLLQRAGIHDIYPSDAAELLRVERALRRWAELECGTDRGCIERDDVTGKPYWLDARTGNRTRMPDREAGAIKRMNALAARIGCAWYHQTDPRGCALYVAPADAGMTAANYSGVGVACCE